jgi:hypothetical protein
MVLCFHIWLNVLSLVTRGLKALKKEEETSNNFVKQEFFYNIVKMRDTNSLLHEIEIHSMYLNWIDSKFNFNSTQFNNYINIQFKSIQIKSNK